MKSIYEFKKGDIVTRVAPAKSLGKSLFNPEGQGDRSYQGDKLIFVGIANGCIYLKRTDILELRIFGNKLIDDLDDAARLDIYGLVLGEVTTRFGLNLKKQRGIKSLINRKLC